MFHYDLSVKHSHIPSQKSLSLFSKSLLPVFLHIIYLPPSAQGCISVQYAEVASLIFSVPVPISNSHLSMM